MNTLWLLWHHVFGYRTEVYDIQLDIDRVPRLIKQTYQCPGQEDSMYPRDSFGAPVSTSGRTRSFSYRKRFYTISAKADVQGISQGVEATYPVGNHRHLDLGTLLFLYGRTDGDTVVAARLRFDLVYDNGSRHLDNLSLPDNFPILLKKKILG